MTETERTPSNASAPVGDEVSGVVDGGGAIPSGVLGILGLGAVVIVVGKCGAALKGGGMTLGSYSMHARQGVQQVVTNGRRFWIGITGYSKWDDEDLLENENRKRIYDLIGPYPGKTITDIEDQMDIARSTIDYHAKVLRDERQDVGHELRNGKRYYFTGAGTLDDDTETHPSVEQLRWTLTEKQFAVLSAIGAHKKISIGELASDLDRTTPTISKHITALEDKDLVIRTDGGRQTYVSTAEAIEDFVN